MAIQNWQNSTLFHGDNLDFMRAMNSETVDLIATDPPFNKGRDFHATPDSVMDGGSFQDRWSWGEEHDVWFSDIQENDGMMRLTTAIDSARYGHSDAMGAFCCFMAVRLLAMRRLLKPTGSIYVHCDPTANSYMRVVMDAIFGPVNFRSEITWVRMTGTKSNTKNKFPSCTDTIYHYVKTNQADAVFTPQYKPYDDEYISRTYKHDDQDGRGRYRLDNIAAPGISKNTYEYKGYQPPAKGWRYTIEKMRMMDAEGRLHFPKKETGRIQVKRYLNEGKGVMLQNYWNDIGNLQDKDAEKTGYNTQKPIALYQRIIEASCPEGGVVLDPFAGCATTCVAAELSGRNWVGIDIWEKVATQVGDRMKVVCDHDILRNPVNFTDKLPIRTDEGEVASPYLVVAKKKCTPKESKVNIKDVKALLVKANGVKCAGCDRVFDRPEYLEVDHRIPRSEGGTNDPENLILLCPPCNKKKSNTLTLTGLRRDNQMHGFMANGEGNFRF